MTDFVFESPTKDPLKKNVYAMHNQESEYKQGSKYKIRYRGNNSMNDEDNNDSSFESIETDQIQKSSKKQGDLESEQVKFGVKLDWCDQSEGKFNKIKSTSNKSVGIGDSQASSNHLRSNNNKLLATPSRLFTSCSKNYLETPNIKMANQVNYLRSFQSNQGKTQTIIPPYSRRLFQDNSDDEEKQPKRKEEQQENMAIENDYHNCDQQKTQIHTKQSEMASTLQKKIDQSFDIPLNKNNMNIEVSKEQELITTKQKIFNPTEAAASSMIKKQMISKNQFKDRLFDSQKEVKFPIQAIGYQNEVKLIDGARIDQSRRLAKQFSVISIMSSKEQGSTVRRCECALTGDQYAIKSIYLGNNFQQNYDKIEVLKEFWTFAPGLLRVKSLWISENYLYLVSRLCRGNLTHLKSSLKANQPLLIQLISDICSALDFLHQKGYSHCNIKPENILLQKHKFKLADFGLSSLQPMNLLNSAQNHNSNQQDNVFVGKDQTDDILQFGKILSELIEEQPQEYNKTSQQEMSHLILVNIIRLMIHPDKTHRPSAREILDKLPSQPGIQQSKQFALLFQENQILKQKVEALQLFQTQTVLQQNRMLH